MDMDPVGPACGSRDWERMGARVYRNSETPGLSEYVGARYEVLFKVWLPGFEEAEFNSVLCRKCGFLAFEPRPDGADIERKYRYLGAHPSTQGEAMSHVDIDRRRSEELYARLSGRLPDPPAAILDFGGGTGGMMSRFLDAGYECWVVDYVETTIPGVSRLGRTVDDIPPAQRFELIICSHVLEHLAEFVGMIQRLAEHLTDTGILYVEVPLEVWDGIPLPPEPVTHFNFFTVPSLRIALERAGVRLLACTEIMTTFEGGSREIAVMAIAQRARQEPPATLSFQGAAEVSRSLFRPPLALRLQRLTAYPEIRRRAFKRWGRRYLPKTFFWRFLD